VFRFGADERSSFDTSNIIGVATREKRVRAKCTIKRDKRLGRNQPINEVLTFTE
jgi:hypothetical protein